MTTSDECSAGKGRYRVWLRKMETDSGIVYVLGGGEKSHIGGAVYKEPGRKPVIMALEGHRDLEVLLPAAKAACQKHGVPVLVTGGIHIDNAGRNDIDMILKNCREMLGCI